MLSLYLSVLGLVYHFQAALPQCLPEMDPAVGALETTPINSIIGIIITKLTKTIDDNKKLRKELKEDLHNIKWEMDMINGVIKKQEESEQRRVWIREVQELAYDIEDKIDEFTCKVSSPKAGWLRKKIHDVKTMGSRTEFAKEIQSLRKRAVEAHNRKVRYFDSAPPVAHEPYQGPSSFDPYIPDDELEGIDEPRQELLELLEAAPQGEPARFRVVSIVGCRGIGKTTLAKVVFRSLQVPCSAWVVASECKDAKGLLAEILSKLLGKEKDTTSSLAELGENLSRYLHTKQRYLIVIDDIQTEVWGLIKFSFPINTDGRIVVTTSIQSIARDWISNGGYVYKMQELKEVHSKALLWKQVCGSRLEGSPDFEFAPILKICNGLPLALVNVANLLKKADRLTSNYCNMVCRDLGFHMQNEAALARMKQVLHNSYDNLPGHDLKICLLYVSIFPKDHEIKRKSLARRWLAEGLVVNGGTTDREDTACGYFDKLIDQSVIHPVHTSNSAFVKTCRVHSTLLAFIVHKSVSENFITFIHDNEPAPSTETPHHARRLSVSNIATETVNTDLSHIRSLSIFSHVGRYLNFQKCKTLRVLDLEKCTQVGECDIKNICKLLHLKYLSLRGTDVSTIPKEISNLHYLETLDIRETRVSIIPIQVLSLPQLAHLFGRFKLPRQLSKVREGNKLHTFFTQKSKLQTLAGFLINGNCGFQQIMLYIRKLRKVKIWSEKLPTERSRELLSSSLQNRLFGNNALQSLSIDFGDHNIDFLDSLKAPCLLTSVKLQGKLTKLPNFIKSLKELELYLSSTALSTECLLALQRLEHLHCLKLVENSPEFVDRDFNIETNGFPRLQRLCIQAPKLPKINIEEGAMQFLISLRLLSEDISGFPLYYIGHIKGLKEVTLSNAVSPDMRKDWEAETKKHENRPYLTEPV